MKKFLITFILILFLLSTSSVFAQGGVNISPEEKDLTASVGEIKSLKITVQNGQDMQDTFSLSVFPQFLKGISADFDKKTVAIGANSNKTAILTFVVPKFLCEGQISQTFNLYATSQTNSEISTIEKIILTVPGRGLCISDIRFDKDTDVLSPEEKTTIKIDITNVNEKPFIQYKIQANVKKDDVVLKRLEKNVNFPEKSKSEINFEYAPEKYTEPGKYQIEISVKDSIGTTIDSQIFYFNVNATNKPPTIKKSFFYGVLFSRIDVKIINENNVPLKSFLYVESVPEFTKDAITPVTKSTSMEMADKRIIYSWLIETMKPGEERLVVYEFRMQNIVALAVLIFIILLIAFNYAFMPKIIKRSKIVRGVSGEREIEISIDVRNRTRHAMHDVVVTDFVPDVVNVVARFGTLKPTWEKKPNGLQLTWNLKKLEPFEERVLEYRIRPKAEVKGMISLPHAHIRYLDKKMKGKILLSKSILVK